MHRAGLQTSNTREEEETLLFAAIQSVFALVQLIQTSYVPTSLYIARYFSIYWVQPSLFWFKCEGCILHAAAHFLVWARMVK